jgi:HAD superfamily hydrolase (TIGR01509 family)
MAKNDEKDRRTLLHKSLRKSSRKSSRESANGQAIIFDLDGTLVDSVYEHVLAWNEALQQEGIEYPSWAIHRRVGMSGSLFLHEVLGEISSRVGKRRGKLNIEHLQKLKKRNFAARVPQVQVLPGARELLKHLSQLGIPWAIATSGAKEEAAPLLQLLKLPAHSLVVTGDEVKQAKPEPDIFMLAADRLRIPINDSIIVGDSVWDLLAARRAKTLGVGLLCGGYGQAELEGAGAYRVYEDPADLLQHLGELGIR